MCSDDKKKKLQEMLNNIPRETREKILIKLRGLSEPEAYREQARAFLREFQK